MSQSSDAPFSLRPPKVEQIPSLNHLILKSKAVWGYDRQFIDLCRKELALSPYLLNRNSVMVADLDGVAIAVVEVSIEDTLANLEKLFVDPSALRSGAGRALLEWAKAASLALGASKLVIESDPGAENFYRKTGAIRVGAVPSGSIAGRVLPKLELALN